MPTGSSGFGMLEVRSVIREPPPAAITTAWNSMLQREHRGRASLNHGRTGQAGAGTGRAEPGLAKTGSVQPGPTLGASASRRRAPPPRLPRAPHSPCGGTGPPPASPLPRLWRPPAPSTSLTGQEWRRRRPLRMRAEKRRAGRSRTAAVEHR